MRSLPDHFSESVPGQLDVMFCGLSGFLVKRMDHKNRLDKFGDVKNSMLQLAMNAQFHNALTDAQHRLPVASVPAQKYAHYVWYASPFEKGGPRGI